MLRRTQTKYGKGNWVLLFRDRDFYICYDNTVRNMNHFYTLRRQLKDSGMEIFMRHEIVSVNPDIEARFYLSIDSGSYVPPHWHDSLELVYMIEGTMTVIFENRKEILRSGEFNIVNSRVIHSVLSEKNKALVLQIPKEILRKFVPNIELYTFAVSLIPANDVEKTRLEKMKKIFIDMHVIYDIRPEGYLLRFNSLLYELLFSLVHSYSSKLVQKEFDRKYCHVSILNVLLFRLCWRQYTCSWYNYAGVTSI